MKNEKIEKIIYQNEDFYVVNTTNYKAKIKGLVNIGDTINILESNVENNKYGNTLNITKYEKTGNDNIMFIKYLFETKVNKVSKKTVEKMVEKFGTDLINQIKNNKEEVKKISKSLTIEKLEIIERALLQTNNLDKLMLLLSSNNFTFAQIKTINEANIQTKDIIKDTFVLYPTIKDIVKIEKLATTLSQDKQSKTRINAYIMYALYTASNNGNLFVQFDDLLEMINNINVSVDSIKMQINELKINKTIVIENDSVYISYNNYIENKIASTINTIKDQNATCKINYTSSKQLSDEQNDAVLTALNNRISIITGGAGVGKTMVIKTIYNAVTDAGKTCALLAPTGKASARMSEVVEVSASTIHSKLNIVPMQETEIEEIIEDYIVIDESSMIDADLFYKLITNISEYTNIVLVGDRNQLLPVGVGSIFADLINSEEIKTTVLNKVFRQNANNSIYINSQKIINNTNDFVFNNSFKMTQMNDEQIADYIAKQYNNDTIVLTPKNVGTTGTKNINKVIQETINKRSFVKTETVIDNVVFRKNDKVMQTRNNYELGVFNGLVGTITSINADEIVVEFENDTVAVYDSTNRGELVLAYALTVHKSQGSEYKNAILVLSKNSTFMNTKQLVYTAITRAKENIEIIGNIEEFMNCINKNEATNRQSNIIKKIKQ